MTIVRHHLYKVQKQVQCSANNNTGYTQKNGTVSKVNKTFISHLTRAQRTPSAAATVQFLMRYQQFASHAYCEAARPVSKMA
jgi:hypothetical protein